MNFDVLCSTSACFYLFYVFLGVYYYVLSRLLFFELFVWDVRA